MVTTFLYIDNNSNAKHSICNRQQKEKRANKNQTKSFDENKHNFEPDHKDSAEFSPRAGHFPDYLNAKRDVLLVRVTPITKSPPHPVLNPTEHSIQLQIQVKY